jgi:predicted lipoprotein with Yx(FWY)xxD motif
MKRLLIPGLVMGAVALVAGGTAAGAHSGAGAHAAKRATIRVTKVGRLGRVLTDGQGRVVYLFEKDKHRKSACYHACATQWPPVLTRGKPLAKSGASARKLGTTRRKNGKTQVTYNGHPIYYYEFDNDKPRRANGQGSAAFGALWYVLNAKGRAVTR